MPTVTDWITALTAILALGAAVWAGHSAYQVNRLERERDREAEWRRRTEQAAGINAWCAKERRAGDEPSAVGLTVANASSAPVYDVAVWSTKFDTRLKPLTMTVLPPGTYFAAETHEAYQWKYPEQCGIAQGPVVAPITKRADWRVVGLEFTDSAGARWRRDHHGVLTAAPDAEVAR